MKRILLIVLSIMLFMTLSACKPDNGIEEVIYVTVYPMQYLVEEIAGDTVLVKRVPGSTVHSESIDWTGKEIVDMINADILFHVNAGVDTYIHNSIDSVFSDGDVTLVDVSQNITYNRVCTTPEHTHLHPEENPVLDCDENALQEDPHFWLDPVRMLQAAELVKDKLIVAYPDNSVLYENNFTVISAALEKLHDDYQLMADEAIKPIITTAMLFTYWHVRYDLEIMSIVIDAHSHSSETLPGDLIEFVEEAQLYFIHEILFEKNANSPAGDQVLQALQEVDEEAKALYLHGLGNLTAEEIEDGSTYISIMYDNLDVLIEATK